MKPDKYVDPITFTCTLDGVYHFAWKDAQGIEVFLEIEFKKGCGFTFPKDSIPSSRKGCLLE